MIEQIERASYRWNYILAIFGGIFLLGMVMLVVSDSFGRYVFLRPIMGALEVAQIMLVWTGFMGLAYGVIMGAHVRMTVVLNRLPQRLRLGAEIFGDVVGIVLFIIVVWGGIQQFWESWVIREVMPASVKLPFWFSKLALPIGALLMTIQLVINLTRQLVGMLLSKRSEG
jgi:TRAP-type C4-dicarboxylate transport system permease small subunit